MFLETIYRMYGYMFMGQLTLVQMFALMQMATTSGAVYQQSGILSQINRIARTFHWPLAANREESP